MTASERELRAHRHGIEFRADIGGRDRRGLPGDVAMQVVKHKADVAVDIPVERKRVDGLASAGDATGTRDLIVEVDLAHASGDFPGTPAAAVERERMRRLD